MLSGASTTFLFFVCPFSNPNLLFLIDVWVFSLLETYVISKLIAIFNWGLYFFLLCILVWMTLPALCLVGRVDWQTMCLTVEKVANLNQSIWTCIIISCTYIDHHLQFTSHCIVFEIMILSEFSKQFTRKTHDFNDYHLFYYLQLLSKFQRGFIFFLNSLPFFKN